MHDRFEGENAQAEASLVGDLRDSRLIYLKGLLFLAIGIAAAAILLVQKPELQTAFLLVVCIWSFCRFYYFAFYVIEHYVDGKFRFAGLFDFARYLISKKPRDENHHEST